MNCVCVSVFVCVCVCLQCVRKGTFVSKGPFIQSVHAETESMHLYDHKSRLYKDVFFSNHIFSSSVV